VLDAAAVAGHDAGGLRLEPAELRLPPGMDEEPHDEDDQTHSLQVDMWDAA
jgi:hypothetical protein